MQKTIPSDDRLDNLTEFMTQTNAEKPIQPPKENEITNFANFYDLGEEAFDSDSEFLSEIEDVDEKSL